MKTEMSSWVGRDLVRNIIWTQGRDDYGIIVLDGKKRQEGRWWLRSPARYTCAIMLLLLLIFQNCSTVIAVEYLNNAKLKSRMWQEKRAE